MTASKPARRHGATCDSPLKGGRGTCGQAAGWGTAHPGVGRCKLHGGNAPIRHGRYSAIKRERIRALIEQYANDPEPLDILPELYACRALFQDFIDRYDEWRDALLAWHESFLTGEAVPKPMKILDISDAYRLLSEATKIVERIERMKTANAVDRPNLLRIMTEMARAVEHEVRDPAVCERIRERWMGIALA